MRKTLVFIISLLMAYFIFADSTDNNKDYAQWWLATYGDYTDAEGKKDWRVPEALGVFERVKNVADKLDPYTARLFVINSEDEPYALALPYGGIIISKKTLDICYTNVKPKIGNQRMAFILGHELAHLANKDFMHREAFLAFKKYGNKKADQVITKHFHLSKPGKAKECRLKELMADRHGVLYASMAGYDIAGLFGKDNNFFNYWVDQMGISNFYGKDDRYPSLKDRYDFIRSQLQAVVGQIELFRAGILLYQKGSYDDAAAAFARFSRTYPAREVFNNIGACHMSIALKRLYRIDREVYYRARLSAVIDHATTAEDINLKSQKHYLQDNVFSRRIDNAQKYFNFAIEKDAQNKTSLCNLSAVLILKEEYAAAQVYCDQILKKDPTDVNALNNKAIAFYYYGKKHDLDTFQKAIQILYDANRISPNNYEVLYNLASLKEKRNRNAGAQQYWQKYLNIFPNPKDNFYKYVCCKLKKRSPSTNQKTSRPPNLKDFSKVRIKLGEELSRIENKLGKENVIRYKIGSEENNWGKGKEEEYLLVDVEVLVKGNLRVLFLDENAEIIELSLQTGKSVQEMLKQYGSPGKIIRHTAGNFYVYEDNGFSFKEINGKVQSCIWFVNSPGET
jgi:tetratricopeptide (TPR) repeat protein